MNQNATFSTDKTDIGIHKPTPSSGVMGCKRQLLLKIDLSLSNRSAMQRLGDKAEKSGGVEETRLVAASINKINE